MTRTSREAMTRTSRAATTTKDWTSYGPAGSATLPVPTPPTACKCRGGKAGSESQGACARSGLAYLSLIGPRQNRTADWRKEWQPRGIDLDARTTQTVQHQLGYLCLGAPHQLGRQRIPRCNPRHAHCRWHPSGIDDMHVHTLRGDLMRDA